MVDRTVPLSEDWQILSRDQVLRSLGLDVLSSTSTLWLIFPTNTIDADAAFSSLPRAKEPDAI